MEAEIRACEEALEAVRIQYEQYFARILRRPPLEEEEALRRRIARLRGSAGGKGAVRFRLEGLHQRLLSFQRMWSRTVREMEEGTYHRDLARLRRTRQAEAPPTAPRPKVGGDAPEESAKLRKLYAAWMDARKRCNQGGSAPSFEEMERSIRKKVPVLLERFKAKSVDFQVVIQDGKAVLKAVPRT